MSRIGKKAIAIPEKVEVKLEEGNVLRVKGPKGEMVRRMPECIEFKLDSDAGTLEALNPGDKPQNRKFHGLARVLAYNMVHGVSEGWQKHSTSQLDHDLERPFPISPFHLWHFWIDLRDCYSQ